MRCAIVIEKANDNFSGYVPDLPGCIATGDTVEQTEQNLREALVFHLEGLREYLPAFQSVERLRQCAVGPAFLPV